MRGRIPFGNIARISSHGRSQNRSTLNPIGQPSSVPISISSNRTREDWDDDFEDEQIHSNNSQGGSNGILGAAAIGATPILFNQDREENSLYQKKLEVSPEEIAHYARHEVLPSMRRHNYSKEEIEIFDGTVCEMASDPNIQEAFMKNSKFRDLLSGLKVPQLDPAHDLEHPTPNTTPQIENTPEILHPWVEKRVEYCIHCAQAIQKESFEPKQQDCDSGDVGSPPKANPFQASDMMKVLVPIVCATFLGFLFIKYGKGIHTNIKGSDLRDCGRLLIMGAFDTLLRKKFCD